MAITLYNPKYFKNGDQLVENEAPVKRFVWSHAYWDLPVGQMKKFPDEVGQAMLRLIDFLVEVTPRNITEIKEELAEKSFKCDECDFQTDAKIAFLQHKKAHDRKQPGMKDLEEVPEAVPSVRFKSQGKTKKPTIDEQEGIPASGQTDGDGVEWYGDGAQTDDAFTPRYK